MRKFAIEKDDFDIVEESKKVQIEESNQYIANCEYAVDLIADIIKNPKQSSAYKIKKIQSDIDWIFGIFSEFPIEGKIKLYQKFRNLSAKLMEQHKNKKLKNKIIVGLGGEFSAGKSAFINSISGIGNLLPEGQSPTTSIPTYIIKSNHDRLIANNVYGDMTVLSKDQMGALTHEFHEKYSIGFSSFVESIIAEAQSFSLPECIALLDTPGYSKYDDKKNAKMSISDQKRAFDQLRTSDYIIWLVDVTQGEITDDSLEFISHLKMQTPILVVFTHADEVSQNTIHVVSEKALQVLRDADIKVYGVAAYSSKDHKEFGSNIIPKFFKEISKRNDILERSNLKSEFDTAEEELSAAAKKLISKYRENAQALMDQIKTSKQIEGVRFLSFLWGKENQSGYQLNNHLMEYRKYLTKFNQEIDDYINGA